MKHRFQKGIPYCRHFHRESSAGNKGKLAGYSQAPLYLGPSAETHGASRMHRLVKEAGIAGWNVSELCISECLLRLMDHQGCTG